MIALDRPMPFSCIDCPMSYTTEEESSYYNRGIGYVVHCPVLDESDYGYNLSGERFDDCPLIEIDDNHGFTSKEEADEWMNGKPVGEEEI